MDDLGPRITEMIGFWLTPWQYRIKHPVSGRIQSIIFEGKSFQNWDDLERIIEARKKLAEVELAGPPPAPGVPRIIRRYNTAKTIHSLKEYEQFLKRPWDLELPNPKGPYSASGKAQPITVLPTR